MKRVARLAISFAIPLLVGVSACWPEHVGVDGSCELAPMSDVDCSVEGYNDARTDVGLVGYACSGPMRPDLDSTVSEGVPLGLLCADKGPLEGSGKESYCCTDSTVSCAFDPAAECEEGSDGYQCFGNNRPESLNPSLLCSNGTHERGLYHYCCRGRPKPSPCKESMAVGCGDRLLGFLCEDEGLPRGADYGANRSRADSYYPMCSIGRTAPNPALKSYCCYMHLRKPVGGTCITHPYMEGCAPGRFGIACYGPDTPEENFPPMKCPEPGVRGRSAEGYESTNYCCDFT
jgi:hypothetical protein